MYGSLNKRMYFLRTLHVNKNHGANHMLLKVVACFIFFQDNMVNTFIYLFRRAGGRGVRGFVAFNHIYSFNHMMSHALALSMVSILRQ